MLQSNTDQRASCDNGQTSTTAGAGASPGRVQMRQLAGAGFEAQEAALKPIQRKKNETGLPDGVKDGVEALSGVGLDAVKVHYNSAEPSAMGAHAYTQGTDIHVAPGQEQHVAHEAWHVVQQSQGRVGSGGPQLKADGGGAGPVCEDGGLEREADVMGAKAAALGASGALAARPARAIQRQARGGAAPVQKKAVKVSGGTFDTMHYEAHDGERAKGAEVHLRFDPDPAVGAEGDTVSLVQTVQDTTRRTFNGGDVTIAPTTSQLGRRTLSEGEEGVGEDDVGTGIDQEVNNTGGRITNRDPRYTEQRMDEGEALKIKARDPNAASVRSAQKGARNAGEWTHAALNDAPDVSMQVGATRLRQFATITGGMDFEVAALHNQSNEFLGSVRWGWRMVGPNAVLNPTELTLRNAGSASARFFKAGKKWNATDLVGTNGPIKPMPVPIPTLESAKRRVESALASYPSRDATPLQTETVKDLFATLCDTWNGLTDEERADGGAGMHKLVDTYYLKVQGRLPAQKVMWEEQKLKPVPEKKKEEPKKDEAK